MNARTTLPLAATILLVGCTHLRMGLFVLRDNPRENDPESVPAGKLAFEANCAQCHGVNADGMGAEASTLEVQPTNFRNPSYSKSASRIGGHIAYGKGSVMPGFVDVLPENTIWDIANYLHSLQSPPRS